MNRRGFIMTILLAFGIEGIAHAVDLNTDTALRVSGDANSVQNCIFMDFRAPAGNARGIHIPSAIEGFRAEVYIWGFDETGDVFLDIDTASVKGLDITVHGNSAEDDNFPATLSHANVAQYVDIPAMWDNTNSIKFVNDATGQVFPLTVGNAY